MSRVFESCIKSLPQGCLTCLLTDVCAEKQLYDKGRADAIKELPTGLYCDGFNYGYEQALDKIFSLAKQNAYDDGVGYSISLQVLDSLIEHLKG